MTLLANYWWALLFSAILIAWVWHTVRRVSRLPPQPIRPVARTGEAAPAPFRRAQVEAMLAELQHREGTAGLLIPPVLLVIVGVVIVATGPDASPRLVIYGGAALGFVFLLLWQRRHRRLVHEVGLACPACGEEQTRALLYSGHCAKCDLRLLDDAERLQAPLATKVSPARNVIGAIILVTVLVWSILQMVERIGEIRRDRCRYGYRDARTAADTVDLVKRGCR
jgi:hypothetical protein